MPTAYGCTVVFRPVWVVLKVQGGDTKKNRPRLKPRQVLYALVGVGAFYFAYTNYNSGNAQVAGFLALIGLVSFYLGFKR
jgi:hypothetical protein